MARFEVYLSRIARRDLLEAAERCGREALNPRASNALLEEIAALSELAGRNPVIDDPVLGAWELRLLRAGDCLAFYRIDGRRVSVARILIPRREWADVLGEIPASGRDARGAGAVKLYSALHEALPPCYNGTKKLISGGAEPCI